MLKEVCASACLLCVVSHLMYCWRDDEEIQIERHEEVLKALSVIDKSLEKFEKTFNEYMSEKKKTQL